MHPTPEPARQAPPPVTPAPAPRPGARIGRWLRRQQAILDQFAIFVANHVRHRLGRTDWLRPSYAIYELTWACNLDCSYCDDGAGRSYPRQVGRVRPAPLAEVRELLRRLRRDVPAIYVTGGEPTVHRDFAAIMEMIAELGFAPVILNTNGLRLPELLARYPRLLHGVDVLIFSLDAVDPARLDRLFQSRAGDGRRALAAFEHCARAAAAAGCAFAVNCVVTRESIADARAVAALCRARGVPFMPVPANRGRGVQAPLVDHPEYAALVREVTGPEAPPALGPRTVVDTLLSFAPFECHPALRLHVTPDGRIPWPCQSDQRLALRILDYPTVPALMRAAEARFSIEGHGRRCGSPCYLAQNVSTDVYLRRPVSVVTKAARDLLFARYGRTRPAGGS